MIKTRLKTTLKRIKLIQIPLKLLRRKKRHHVTGVQIDIIKVWGKEKMIKLLNSLFKNNNRLLLTLFFNLICL